MGLNKSSRLSLINAIEKYNKWNKIAIAKNVALKKEITWISPLFYYQVESNRSYRKDATRTYSGDRFKVMFVSGDGGLSDSDTHYLVFQLPTTTSYENRFTSISENTRIEFSYSQANQLKEFLSQKEIDAFKVIARQKEEDAKLFD
jgi:IS4 transposase